MFHGEIIKGGHLTGAYDEDHIIVDGHHVLDKRLDEEEREKREIIEREQAYARGERHSPEKEEKRTYCMLNRCMPLSQSPVNRGRFFYTCTLVMVC